MESTTLGRRIGAARKQAGLTQGDIAKKFGIARQTVSLWECDATTPQAEAVRIMARELGVDVMWLLFGDFPAASHKYAPETFLREDISRYKEDNKWA